MLRVIINRKSNAIAKIALGFSIFWHQKVGLAAKIEFILHNCNAITKILIVIVKWKIMHLSIFHLLSLLDDDVASMVAIFGSIFRTHYPYVLFSIQL